MSGFHGELIYEYPEPVSFLLDENEKARRIEDFIEFISENCYNPDLAAFIEKNASTFFENKVSHEDKTMSIPKGMKLVKSFSHFIKDKEMLTYIQNRASQIIQEDKVEGTLCFSVHPLDFLSVSENTYNWRSCHALDGDYRAGNLSYMMDKITCVCYIKSKDGVKLPNFPFNVPWNSKKWRVLLYLSEDNNLLFAGRQYPFSSAPGLDIVKTIFLDLFDRNMNYSDWISPLAVKHFEDYTGRKWSLREDFICLRGHLKPFSEVVSNAEGALQFNDLTDSSFYKPLCAAKHNSKWMDVLNTHLIIGEAVPCLRCKQNMVARSYTMQCDDCEELYGESENDDFTYCSCCDRHIAISEALDVTVPFASNLTTYETVCEDCFNAQCFQCASCLEYSYNSYKCVVNGKELCRHCYNEIKEETENG